MSVYLAGAAASFCIAASDSRRTRIMGPPEVGLTSLKVFAHPRLPLVASMGGLNAFGELRALEVVRDVLEPLEQVPPPHLLYALVRAALQPHAHRAAPGYWAALQQTGRPPRMLDVFAATPSGVTQILFEAPAGQLMVAPPRVTETGPLVGGEGVERLVGTALLAELAAALVKDDPTAACRSARRMLEQFCAEQNALEGGESMVGGAIIVKVRRVARPP